MYKKVVEKFVALKIFSLIRDDDAVDQIHHRMMVIVLVIMTGFFSAKTKWGSIDCWVPKEYNDDNFKLYIQQYCWISNMYNVPFSEYLPEDVDERMSEDRSLRFYRWVFLVFLLQALMFKFPNFIWRSFNTFSGINIKKVVELAIKSQLEGEEDREMNTRYTAEYIHRWLKSYRHFDSSPLARFQSMLFSVAFCLGKRSGRFLTRLYLFVKVLYLINVLVQFQILSAFLGFNFWGYGADVVRMLQADAPMKDLDHFPRVSMCDFEIRQLQNIQRHTVQCALPINMYLEKAYAALWFIFVILALATLISLIKWTVAEVFTSRREGFLNKYLEMLREMDFEVDVRLFQHFVRRYLRDDGVFLMRIVTNNAGELLAFDILKLLWAKYKKELHKSDDDEDLLSDTKPLTNGPE
ncbi:innexin unc-9-like [Haliotis rubra]|uniref:innexin unc-9-like n=1 Tax=Haliotis rubra TaxID=36100 RepID=UPI001EE55BA1|nr:innexin unc-9-like [Haliotis rubra]